MTTLTGLGAKALSMAADVADEARRLSLAPLVDLDLKILDELHRTNIRGTFVVDQLHGVRREQGGRRGDDVHPRA